MLCIFIRCLFLGVITTWVTTAVIDGRQGHPKINSIYGITVTYCNYE